MLYPRVKSNQFRSQDQYRFFNKKNVDNSRITIRAYDCFIRGVKKDFMDSW